MDLHFKKVILLHITNDWRDSTPNYNEGPLLGVGMVLIKKSVDNKCWRGCGKRELSSTVSIGMGVGTATVERVWRFLKKLKLEVPYYSTVPFPGIYPPKVELNKIHAPSVHIYLCMCAGTARTCAGACEAAGGAGAGAGAGVTSPGIA